MRVVYSHSEIPPFRPTVKEKINQLVRLIRETPVIERLAEATIAFIEIHGRRPAHREAKQEIDAQGGR